MFTISNKKRTDNTRFQEILSKSLALEILPLEDISFLLSLEDKNLWQEIFHTARQVKEKVYGRRIVLFAPLYLSNECLNNCLYCGFRRYNKEAKRKTLHTKEAVEEAKILARRGYKRLLLVAGEHPVSSGFDYLSEIVSSIYNSTDIRILHLNAAPMSKEQFRLIKDTRLGVYQCFQETYHFETYKKLHPSGPKSNYQWRLDVMDRAIEGGFEDIGMGVLLGLYDWRWDVFALLSHCHRLIQKYGFGPHTLSVPRLQPAQGAAYRLKDYEVSDQDFKKIVAIYRLALPHVGIVVTTREPSRLRDELFFLGVSQISAGSRTNPGGYVNSNETEQFSLMDNRTLEEIINRIASLGLIPSLCTSCYRKGRSGQVFKHIAQNEGMKSFCMENAVLSLKEYIMDNAGSECKKVLSERLLEEVKNLGNGIDKKLREIEKGKRDIHI